MSTSNVSMLALIYLVMNMVTIVSAQSLVGYFDAIPRIVSKESEFSIDSLERDDGVTFDVGDCF
jgi:hypothetical protein